MRDTFETTVERPLRLFFNQEKLERRDRSREAVAPAGHRTHDLFVDRPVDLPAAGTNLRRILVPTDFSAPSSRAMSYAHRLAEQLHGELLVLYVELPLHGDERNRTRHELQKRREELHLTAEERLHKQLSNTIGLTVGGRLIQTVIHEGYPHRGIVHEADARGADVIVMARHGHSDSRSLLMGPTAEYVLRHARCPVLLIDDPA